MHLGIITKIPSRVQGIPSPLPPLLLQMGSGNQITPTGFVNDLRSSAKFSADQQDAHRAYLEIVERYFRVDREKGTPFDLKIQCFFECANRDCPKYAVGCSGPKEPPLPCISLASQQSVNVTARLTRFFEPEKFDKENLWRCSACDRKTEGSTKRVHVIALPDVLVLHLQPGRGSADLMDYPEQLDMRKYISGHPRENCVYVLVSVLRYHGNSTSKNWGNSAAGHYVSLVKSLSGEWFDCDDSVVQPCADHNPTGQEFMLFFVRRS